MPVPYLIGTGTAPSATFLTVTPGVTTTAGDTYVLGASSSATSVVSSVTDTAGNTWVEENSSIAQNPCSVWVAQGATKQLTPSTVITVTFSSLTGTKSAGVVGCTGLLKAVDQNPSPASSGGSASPSITSGTLSAANEVAVGICVYGNAGGTSLTWASPWTAFFSPLLAGPGGEYIGMAWRTTTTTSALTSSGTITSSRWCMLLLTFADTTVPQVLSQWSLAGGQYNGTSAVDVRNTPGNMLVAFIGWSSPQLTPVNPVSNVADDANDFWFHLGTSSQNGVGRVSVWCCPQARPGPGPNGGASVVAIGTSGFVAGIAALVVEFPGAPQYAVTDFAVTGFGAGSSLTVAGTATTADLALAVAMGSNFAATITGPGGSWNDLEQVSADGFSPNDGDVILAPAWQSAPAGSVSATWNASVSSELAGVVVGVQAMPAAPTQVNANWPQLHIEAAFGYQPGNPQVMPSWTDITQRAIDNLGNAVAKTSRGRSYELTQPEAGETAVKLNNSDGAFTPGNTASPYYPNVALELPVRIYANWQGAYYAIGQGYTERLPQSWPDLPQFGFSPLTAVDGLGMLANSAMPSALAGEYLTDFPYLYFPCSEEYATGSATSGSVTGAANGGAAGQTLANLSRINTAPAVCVNGVARTGGFPAGTGLAYYYLETGLTLGLTSAVNNSPTGVIGATLLTGLLGDPGGGIGISSLPATATGPGWTVGPGNGLFTGPGARYTDPGLPQLTSGITLAFWAIIPAGLPAGFIQTLLRYDGDPCNYFSSRLYGAVRLLVRYDNTFGPIVIVGDHTGASDVVIEVTGMAGLLDDGNPHFWVVTCDANEGEYGISLWIDGVLAQTANSTGVTIESDSTVLGIGAPMDSTGATITTWNYTIGHVAVFTFVAPQSRITAWYNAGGQAWAGDSAPERFGRILTWSGYGLARAADAGSPTPVFGPADQVQGQSASAACYTVAQTDDGMLYADAAGNVTLRSRAALYNKPTRWWFGDAPVQQGPLNANPYFTSTVSPWTAVNSATLALSGAWSQTGTSSLLITGNGSTASPGAQSELIPVIAGVTYQIAGYCLSPQGWSGGFGFTLNLYNAAGSLVTSVAGTTVKLPGQAPMVAPVLTATIPLGESITQARIVVGATGTPATSVQFFTQPVMLYCAEVPMEQGSEFGYDNTFVWNLLTAQQQVNSAYDGSSATVIDLTSQEEYFTRGGSSAAIDQTLETTSYQDVLDEVNWSIVKYRQPQLRMTQIVVDAASKADAPAAWPTVLGIEQGDICNVVRRPIGGAVITETGIVQKVQHDIGPNKWTVTILVVPYAPANAVLTADTNDVIGSFALPW